MKQVNHNELEEVFNMHYESKQPLFIHGTTGIGKSHTVQEQAEKIAEKNDREFILWHSLSNQEKQSLKERKDDVFVMFDIRLASYDPSDIQGIPNLEDDVLRFMPPEWVDVICEDGFQGIVFLDEANLAPPLVQSALYQLVLDRKVGSRHISDEVYVVAAGNREGKDRANIHQMAAPLADRFGHVELQRPLPGDPDADGDTGTWTEWAIENDVHEWVISFLISGLGDNEDGYLFTFEDDNMGDEHSFATPRSWETVSDLLKTEDNPTPEKAGQIASIWVGSGVGTEFESFIDLQMDIEIESYLQDPSKGSEVADMDFHKTSALLTGLAAKFRDKPEETIGSIIKIAGNIPDDSHRVFLLRTCRQYGENNIFVKIISDEERRKTLPDWDEKTWLQLTEDISTHFM